MIRDIASPRKSQLYNWSVLMALDSFGTGYIAQPSAENRDAMDDGWSLITDGLALHEACQLRDTLKDEACCLEYAAAAVS